MLKRVLGLRLRKSGGSFENKRKEDFMNSDRFSLNSTDWKKWATNFLKFSAPSLLVALGGLQAGLDWRVSLGMGISSLLTAAIDLTRKYVSEG